MQGISGRTMKVGIVGAGAMGSLLGSFLSRVSQEVWLVDVWEEHVNHINRNGLEVLSDAKPFTAKPRATSNTTEVGICDLVVISTKFHHTKAAVDSALCMIGDETTVMTVQNGIGNVEAIAKALNPNQVIFGLTTLGSVMRGPGRIEVTFAAKADTYLWPVAGEPDERIRNIVDHLNRTGLRFHLSPDTRQRVWKKLCLNAGLSVVVAIPRLRCGDFVSQPASLEIVKGLVYETVAVANKEGVELDRDEAYEYVINLAKQAPHHLPSPLIDVLHKRKTEIDCLNGALVEKASQHGIDVPCNKLINHLIQIIENTYDKIVNSL